MVNIDTRNTLFVSCYNIIDGEQEKNRVKVLS